MYREIKSFDGKEMGEVLSSITVERSLPEMKDFLLSIDQASEVLGNRIEMNPVGKDSFEWSFDGPLVFDFQGKGNISAPSPTTVMWRAQDQDKHAFELKMELQKAGHGTKIKLSCVFEHPSKAVEAIIRQIVGLSPEGMARSLLANVKALAEGRGALLA